MPIVSVLLADEAQFAYKLDQIELQLYRSQLPYSEYLSPVLQEAAQPNSTKKGPPQNYTGYNILIACEFKSLL